MALRSPNAKTVAREIFTKIDPEILDGTSKSKTLKPARQAPPPPPPSIKLEKNEPLDTFINNNIILDEPPASSSTITNISDSTTLTNQSLAINNNSDNEITSNLKLKAVKVEINGDKSPPAAPPRKRSNNKPVTITTSNGSLQEAPTLNKTIVRIVNNETHKLKIKNEFSIGPIVSNEKKTSILISGDDCYSTVNVNDDVPLYQSSVVVNDGNVNQIEIKYNKSSTVYITSEEDNSATKIDDSKIDEYYTMNCFDNSNDVSKKRASSDYLMKLLNDPVEAVRMNLVPHVCGKSDVLKKEANVYDPVLELFNGHKDEILTKLQLLALDEDGKDDDDHSTQYEIMDHGSDCYTDNSNRSSITEEELATRTKFYDLLSDTVPIEVSDSDDHHYESISKLVDPIYEEIEIPPPLPSNPPPPTLLDDLQIDKELTTRYVPVNILTLLSLFSLGSSISTNW